MEDKIFNSTSYQSFPRKPVDRLNSANSSFAFSPPDPLIQRTIIPLKKAEFGRDIDYIELPPFNHPKKDDKLYEFEIQKQEVIISKEREMPIDLYLNNVKRLQKLIYEKNPPDEKGRVSFENIVDLTKKKKSSGNEKEINEIVLKKVEFLEFESRFESGNLELAYLCDEICLDAITSNNLAHLNNNNPYNTINVNNNYYSNSVNNTIGNNNNNTNNNNPTNNIIYVNNTESDKKTICHNYLLFLHNDTNTTGYTQWFFFRVKKGKKGEKYNFSIMNVLKSKTKYHYGLKIWMYSTEKNKKLNVGWHHTTENVYNYRNNLYRIINNKRKYYSTLSFDYTFEYDNDTVFFANCIPYTYTDLMKQLNEYQLLENTKYPFFIRKTLCTTIAGNDLDYITINNMDCKRYQNDTKYSSSYKKTHQHFTFSGVNISGSGSSTTILSNNDSLSTGNSSKIIINASPSTSNSTKSKFMETPLIVKEGVILMARIHPSETVGSWAIKGAIDFLMGDSPEANYLRDNFIFKIIPMLNPDGVIFGCTRTSFAGCDLNRRWIDPSDIFHPEIYAAKELIKAFDSQRKIACVVDFHGHFGAFNSFFYCNRDKDNFTFCKYFPFLCSKISKIIEFDKCKFSMPRYKRGTGRIDLYRELNIENIFTLESSNFGCITGEYKNNYLNINLMQQIGVDVCMAILKYHYSSKNKMGIYLIKTNYPMLEEKIANEIKEIEKNFDTFCLTQNNDNKNEDEDKDENEKNNNDNNNNEEDEKNNEEDDDKNGDEDDEESESDPSGDNLDIEELKRLIPCGKKKHKKYKKNKLKKLNSKLYTKKTNSNIENLTQNLNKNQISLPQVKNNGNNKNKPLNNTIKKPPENNNNPVVKKPATTPLPQKNVIVAKPLVQNPENNLNETKKVFIIKVNSYTQTEDIFFKMHWSYFIGTCVILTPKIEYFNKNRKNYNSIVASSRRNINFDNIINNSIKSSNKRIPLNNFFNGSIVNGHNNYETNNIRNNDYFYNGNIIKSNNYYGFSGGINNFNYGINNNNQMIKLNKTPRSNNIIGSFNSLTNSIRKLSNHK